MKVTFTYDVRWEYSNTPWADRWDQYINGNPEVGAIYETQQWDEFVTRECFLLPK